MTASRILLTGFEPFGGEQVNPSWLVAQALHRRRIAGHVVQAIRLPCVFGESLQVLDAALARWQPAVVLALGQAGGRGELTIERVAINIDDASIPDNAGQQPIDTPVAPRGPAAHFSTLPIKAMCAAVQAAGVAAGVSQTAGTFVCNHVFYGLQHRLRRTAVRSGFMHVPWLPEQAAAFAGGPSMPLAQMVLGTRAALEAAVRNRGDDLRLTAGAIA